MAGGQNTTVHLVMVPYPLQGHINPMVQFAKTLIRKHSDIIVTFVNNHYNNTRILENQSSSECTETELYEESNLRFVSVDNGMPEDFDYTDIRTRDQWKQFNEASCNMKEPFKKLVQSLNRGDFPVSCIVFGSFCPWAHYVAQEFSIPSAFFWTQSASVFSIYFHAELLAANGFFPFRKPANGVLPQQRILASDPIIDNGTKNHILEKDVPAMHIDASDIVEKEGPAIHMDASEASNLKINVEIALNDRLIDYIPGVPPLRYSTFPTLIQVDDLDDPTLKTIRGQCETLSTCDQIIINSFSYLEPYIHEAFKKHKFRLSLVGPLLPLESFELKFDANKRDIRGSNLLLNNYECLSWLDTKPKASVLYVSFGSVFMPQIEDLQSIASAIMSMKQPFLWVIKPRTSLKSPADIFPKEFLEETCDYGLIIPWAPQLQVLSHPSIGAFLTHCGWNSTLESVSLGVPLICFPIISDQPTNSTFITDIWKVGLTIKRGNISGKVDPHEIEKVICRIIIEEDGKNMRTKAKRLQNAAKISIQPQGSSHCDLETFVGIVREKSMLKQSI